MIITVTLNPSLDRTVEVDDLVRGEVLRARGVHLHPGGKGVNVTRALLANGVASRAVLPVAGAEGDQLVGLLTAEAVDVVTVPVSGRTRSNVTIAEADGTVTKLNEPGPALDAGDLDRLLDRALATVEPHGWVVLCGSLPPGVPTDHYAAMTRRAHQAGARVALDTSGPALVEAMSAAPDLIKPNAEELAEAAGTSLGSRADVVEAAQRLRGLGAGRVLVSLGGDGALLVDDAGVAAGESHVASPRSTVGAGDAFLAGFLAAEATGAPARAALAQALAWGAAAVTLPGSQMPGPHDIDHGAVHLLPDVLSDERLAEPFAATG